jgi:hypothetical protein
MSEFQYVAIFKYIETFFSIQIQHRGWVILPGRSQVRFWFRIADILIDIFYGFAQSLQENAIIWNKSRPIPYRSFPIYHS